MDARDAARFDRHLRLDGFGADGQRRLAAASVLIVGVGGLGCPAAQALVASGVRRLTLVDPDVVAWENLHRQTLFGEADVGHAKVEAAAGRLLALDARARLRPVRAWVGGGEDAAGPGVVDASTVVPGHDAVVDATDSRAARLALNDACQAAGVPLIHGALHASDGQVAVFPPGGPCYRCLFPQAPPEAACAEVGVLGPVASLVGTHLALECLKVLSGYGEPLAGRLLLLDGKASAWECVRFEARRTCPCQGRGTPARGRAGGLPEVRAIPLDGDAMALHDEGPALDSNAPALDSNAPALREEAATHHADPTALEVDLAGFQAARRAGALVLDVRASDESDRDPVAGSLCIPAPRLAARIGEVPRQRDVMVVCSHGQRSRRAAQLLRRQGRRAWSLQGGLATLRGTPGALAAYPVRVGAAGTHR